MHTNSIGEQKKFAFIEKLANQLPTLPPALQQTIADLFASYSHNLDHFSFAVNALQSGYNYLTPQITQIAAHILNGHERAAKKREAQPLEEPKAKRQHLETAEEKAQSFLQQLLKNADSLDFLEKQMDLFLVLLASENPSIFKAAWQCLAELYHTDKLGPFFCNVERIQTLLSALESAANSQRKSTADPIHEALIFEDPSTFASRLTTFAHALQACSNLEPLTEALCILVDLLRKYKVASQVKYTMGKQEAAPLLLLMQAADKSLVCASLAVQAVFNWDPHFISELKDFSIQNLYNKSIIFIKEEVYGKHIVFYLGKLYHCFSDVPTDSSPLNNLPAILLDLAETAKSTVAYPCCMFFASLVVTEFQAAFENGAERMLACLKDYSVQYKSACKAKQTSVIEMAALRDTLAQAMACSSKFGNSLDPESAQTLCTALIDLLNSSDSRIITEAVSALARLSFNSKEKFNTHSINIGLQCIPLISSLLASSNLQVVNAALGSLKILAWSAPNQACLLSTDVFERIKELILTSEDTCMVNALLLGSECLTLRKRIEEADANFVEHLFSLAINGPHQVLAMRALHKIVQVENFPLQSGKETLAKILAMRKKADPLLTEAIYWYLGNLAKMGLANELYQLGVLEDIALIWNAEAFSEKVVEGFCFCFCEIAEPILKEAIAETSLGQASAFSATARIDAVLCLLSPAFNSKYVKCQETACWLTHKIATIPGADLQKISHCAFAKGVALLASPNESVAQGAMWLAGRLLQIPSNYSKTLFEEMIDKLLGWLEKGQPKSQLLALRVLGTMSSNHAAICPAMIDKGVLAKVLPLVSNLSLRELAIWLAGCLTAHARPAIKQYFTEEKILRYLSSESPKIKEGMVFILAAMGPLPVSENGQKTIANLLWPLTADKTAGLHIFKALAHVHPKENLLSLLQSKEPISKNTFLIFLNILSQYNITTPPYISPLANELSPYAAVCQSHAHLSDIALHVEGAEALHCHKVVLAIHSGYFQACFLSGMLENQQSVVSIKDVNQDAFKKCIQFIYEQQYAFTTIADAKDMLQMAQRFQVPNLEAACIQFLVSQLTPNAAEEICQIASHSMELQIQVMQWMMHNYCRLPEKLQQQIEDDEMWFEFYKVLTTAEN